MTKQIAWTGTKSRYVTTGNGTLEIDEHHENRRDIPFFYGGKAGGIRSIGRESGLSREYIFGGGAGPESFILEMDDADADKLLLLPGEAENFKDVTNDPGFFARYYRPLDEIFSEG